MNIIGEILEKESPFIRIHSRTPIVTSRRKTTANQNSEGILEIRKTTPQTPQTLQLESENYLETKMKDESEQRRQRKIYRKAIENKWPRLNKQTLPLAINVCLFISRNYVVDKKKPKKKKKQLKFQNYVVQHDFRKDIRNSLPMVEKDKFFSNMNLGILLRLSFPETHCVIGVSKKTVHYSEGKKEVLCYKHLKKIIHHSS